MRKLWLACTVTLFFLMATTGVMAAEVVDRIVAIVNGEIITLHDLNLKMQPLLFQIQGRELGAQEQAVVEEMRKKILREIINSRLINQETDRLQMKVSDTEVENHIRQVKETNGLSDTQMEEELRLQGLDIASYREKVRQDILQHQYLTYTVRRKVVITDEDIERYYQEHTNDFVAQKQVVFQLILLPDEKEIRTLARKVEEGKLDFGEQAQKYSQGLEVDDAGNIGPVDLKALDGILREKLEALTVQEIGEPFSFAGNWALLKLVRMVDQDPVSREEVREKIREILFKPLIDRRFEEVLNELRDKAVIKVLL